MKQMQIHEETQKCLRCSICQTVCPIFKELRIEMASPRGRVRIIREYLEGRLQLSKRFQELIYLCLTCKSCHEVCPAKIKIADLIKKVREEIVLQNGLSLGDRIIKRKVLGTRGILLSSFVKGVYLYNKLGLGKIVKLEKKREKMIPDVFWSSFSKQLAHKRPSAKSKGKIGYFLGCLIDHLYPNTGEATINILEKLGYAISLPKGLVCCGVPQLSHGDKHGAYQLALKNMELFNKSGADIIVSDCSSCSSGLKAYGQTFAGWKYEGKLAAFSAQVKDITLFLWESGGVETKKTFSTRVTYHDPCHLVRQQNITREPRELIRQLPGVEFIEMEGSDQCCGGAGSFAFDHPELSNKILARKLDHILKTDAEIVVTGCPSCRMQIQRGLTERKSKVKVIHLVELINT